MNAAPPSLVSHIPFLSVLTLTNPSALSQTSHVFSNKFAEIFTKSRDLHSIRQTTKDGAKIVALRIDTKPVEAIL